MRIKTKQMSLIVRSYRDSGLSGNFVDNTEELNKLLEQDWKVISSNPMGAYGAAGGETISSGNGFASLVILQKEDGYM